MGEDDAETLANVSAGDWDFDDPIWDDVSDLAKDFICKLMQKDKNSRMSAQEALQHPWITVGSRVATLCMLSECPFDVRRSVGRAAYDRGTATEHILVALCKFSHTIMVKLVYL